MTAPAVLPTKGTTVCARCDVEVATSVAVYSLTETFCGLACARVPKAVRIMVNEHYDATTPKRARIEYGVRPDILLVRRDGWVLGAPSHLAALARSVWSGDWVEEWERTPTGEWRHVR